MRFFLDNCLSPRHANALAALLDGDHAVAHLSQRFPRNTPDEEWITRLGSDGDWIVITGDSRISRNHHERKAWEESGLTMFYLKKGWMNLKVIQQHVVLVKCLEQIIDLAASHPKGSSFSITVNGKIEEC